MPQSRQLAAIMFTDIVGYTALMGNDEQKAFELLNKNRQIQKPIIKQFNGRLIKELGDGIMASFKTVSDAVSAAIKIQEACSASKELSLRIGIHEGEIIFENNDIYGDAVNIASRIQTLGVPGSILFSKKVTDEIKNKAEFQTLSLGNFEFKNVNEPIEVFALANEGFPVPKRSMMDGKLKKKNVQKRNVIAAFSIILFIAAAFLIYKNFLAKNDNAEVTDKSIAILPFFNISNDPQQEYFVDGMMDEILNHLFKIGGLRIISRTSAMAYKGTKKSMKDIAHELGVANLLEGSVQKEGQRIKIRVQLIDGKTDEHIWVETYEREFKDVFAIQSDIAQKVASELKIKIDPDVKRRIESRPTENTEAYNLYLQAIDADFMSENQKYLLESAIKLDTGFAEAYSTLSFWWLAQGSLFGVLRAEEVLKNALPLLQKALQINPELASANVAMAQLNLWYKWDFNAVENKYRKVQQLYPSNTEIPARFSDYLLSVGRTQEALEVNRRALNNDKNNFFSWQGLATAYSFNNNPQKALETIETASSLFDLSYVIEDLIKIKLFAQKYLDVIQEFEKKHYTSATKPTTLVLGYTAIAYFKTGQIDKADNLLNELEARSKISPVGSPSFFIAGVYTAIGKNDLALKWLEKAYSDHEVEMYWLKVEPTFKPLYNDIRFQNIINRIGYPK